jgi:hypothetical protein
MSDRLAELYRRRAALGRELAALDEAIAVELAGAPAAPPRLPGVRKRGPRIPQGIEITDTDRAAARRAAAGKGMLGSS